jgi:hypothetical protein
MTEEGRRGGEKAKRYLRGPQACTRENSTTSMQPKAEAASSQWYQHSAHDRRRPPHGRPHTLLLPPLLHAHRASSPRVDTSMQCQTRARSCLSALFSQNRKTDTRLLLLQAVSTHTHIHDTHAR